MSKLPEHKVESARETDIVAVVEKYGVKLEKVGKEFKGLCPFHSEKSPSFTVTPAKNRYHCFGCGQNGTPISFVQDYLGVSFREAVNIINGENSDTSHTPREKRVIERDVRDIWTPMPIVPDTAGATPDIKYLRAPADFTPPKGVHSFTGNDGAVLVKHVVDRRWAYRNAAGLLIGYITRINLAWGGKEVIPQTYCTNSDTGEIAWRWQSFSKPRPMYGLELLAANPKAQVLIVEGEKACDAARQLFASLGITPAKLVVVSWPGGSKAIKHVDWSPLAGRSVALWPDADQKNYPDIHPQAGQMMPFLEQVGTVAMQLIYEAIKNSASAVKMIMPPDGVPDGWDVADELPAGFDLKAHMKAAGRVASDVFTVAPEPEAAQEPVAGADNDTPPWEGEDTTDYAKPVPAADVEKPKKKKELKADDMESPELAKNGYFRVLGYDHDRYYIMQYEKCQIMVYSKSDFSEPGLIDLAPVDWWELHFGESGKIEKKAAMNWIVRTANRRGVYDMSRLRGRGAWIDAGRNVFHHGDHLTVDGEPVSIAEFESRYVYEMARPLPDIADTPLTDDEGRDLLDLAAMFRWAKPASAALLTGWIALAPICGALRWRSHIWITGGAGCGKAQPHSAGVLTPTGWSTMGELSVGDFVSTPDNHYGRILGVFPQGRKKVYKFTFADGRTTRATGDHLWKVREKHQWRIRTTDQMIEILGRGSRATRSLAIPLCEQMTVRNGGAALILPLHPYVLGLMLGDGSFGGCDGVSGSNLLTCFDPEIVARANVFLQGSEFNFFDTNVEGRFRLGDLSRYGRKTRETIKELRLLGTKSETKFIPRAYLDASIEDRIELLKGLMDTDGHAGTAGSISYCTTSPELRDGVVELVRSLGGIAAVTEKVTHYTYKEERRQGRLAYNINIRLKDPTIAFGLQRKIDRVSADHQYADCLYLNVSSIEEDGEEDCSCIMIDHPDRLYVTDEFVVTHNTTILNDFTHHLLNGMDLFAQGNSSEAGIRQRLKGDAIPVLFDESESNSERDAMRIQSVLSLVRQSSSESPAEVLKGTAGGDAMSFHIRSMFCLSSIQVGVKQQADIDRMTVLSLMPRREDTNAADTWIRISDALHVMNRDEALPGKLVCRSLKLLPITLMNIKTFSEAAAMRFGSQREGDQYGTLLAGAWSVISSELVDLDGALGLIDSYDWSEHRENNEVDESERAMSALMGALIKVSGVDISVNELVRVACGQLVEGVSVSQPNSAEAVLQRHGIRTRQSEGVLILSNTSEQLKHLMVGTPFEADLRGVLLRVKGARRYPKAVKFSGIPARAISLPLDPLLTDDIINGDGTTEF